MQDFNNLKVGKRAHDLTMEIYKRTASFPTEERYGLTSQLRRAAASIPTNLAEGCERQGHKEMANFINIARGSASEVEYLLFLACELKFLDEMHFKGLSLDIVTIKKMLTGLYKSVTTETGFRVPRN